MVCALSIEMVVRKSPTIICGCGKTAKKTIDNFDDVGKLGK